MDIVEFLTARLDEDEGLAKAANPGPWRRITDQAHLDPNTIFGGRWMGDLGRLRNVCSIELSWEKGANAEHIARWDPARVLAEIEAKRAILDLHPNVNDGDCGTCVDGDWGYPTNGGARAASWPCGTLKALAQPCEQHPDFDPAWKVSA